MHYTVPQNASEWNTESDVILLAKAYRGRRWFPKLRLFAVTCCRRHFDVFPEGPCRTAIEISECYAQGHVGKRDLNLAANDVRELVYAAKIWTGRKESRDKEPEKSIAMAALACTLPAEHPAICAPRHIQDIASMIRYREAIQDGLDERSARELSQQVRNTEASEQTIMLREIAGNPFL